jgi:hypothetical protein
MKKILINIMMFAMLMTIASAFTGSGTGTTIDPYIITTCDQLQEMEDDLAANYVINNNIDCSATTLWNSGQGFKPVGYYDDLYNHVPFTGYLNGQNYLIEDLFMNWTQETDILVGGLFGTTLGATISNLSITGADINFGHDAWGSVGILVGNDQGSSTIENITVQGSITSTGYLYSMGGVIAEPYSLEYTNIHADIVLTGEADYVGGLGGGFTGGIVIRESSAKGLINATALYGIGGLSGDRGNFYDSYAQVDIYGSATNVGGLLGSTGAGEVVNRTYSAGVVAATGTNVGGLIGGTATSAINSFYDSDVSGQNDTKGTPKNTVEMMSETTFAGWDFVNTWVIDEGISYPYFQSEIVPNTAPIIDSFISVGPTSSHYSETIFFSVSASDPEEDPLSYEWYLNDTLQVGEETATYSVDVTEDTTLQVYVVVSDGELNDTSNTIVFEFDLLGYEPTYNEDDIGTVVIDTGAKMILGMPAKILGMILGLALAAAVLFGIRVWSKKK